MNTFGKQDGSKTIVEQVLVGAALLLVALFGIRTISNADFWSHLAIGRWISGNGIPRLDSLSFTAAGLPWINISWLYDRILLTLWNAGGPGSVIVVHMLAVTAAFAMLLPLRKPWAGGASTALALVLCAWILAPRFVIGSQAFALLFAAAFILVLSRAAASVIPWIVIIPLQILWTNMHSSFLVGPIICAVFAIEAFIRNRSVEAGGESQKANPNMLVGLAVVAFLMTLISPYHVRAYGQVLGAIGGVGVTEAREWISPFSSQFKASASARHLVTLALIIGAGGLVAERRKLPLALTTLAVGSAFFVVLSLWHAAFFALLAFPFIALSLKAIGDALSDLIRKLLSLEAPALPVAGTILTAVLIVLSLGSVTGNAYYAASGSASSFGLGAVKNMLPAEAAAVLEKPAFPARVFNLPTDGGFLLWTFPEREVFIDSRAAVYGADIFSLGARCLVGDEKAWAEVDEQWGVRAAIFNCTVPGATHTIRTLLAGRRWMLVYFDGATAILVRALSEFEALVRDAEIQQHGLRVLEQERAAYAQKLGRMRRPANSPRLIGAANLYMALGRYEELRAVSALLVRGVPEMAPAWQYLGVAELQLGNLDAAEHALTKAAQMMPKNVWPLLQLSRIYARQGDRTGERLMLDRARKLSVPVTEAFLAARGFDETGQPEVPAAP